ncbi:ankyrin repeat-containing domain protein [Chytridium lagenaria]|nr:ankyrin repeat-containing domain protein [Chytridium lagenaria]
MDPKVLANLSFALLVQRSIDMTILFLRCGVPWNQRDQKGATILHYGARWGDLTLVVAVQQFGIGVDFNIKGENDWTPLHEAVSNRRFEVMNYLVRHGADSNIIANGETPRELGLRIGISMADLDDYLSPLKAAPERELVIINEVKWTRINSDQPGGVKGASSTRGGYPEIGSPFSGNGITPNSLVAPGINSISSSPATGSPAPGSPTGRQSISSQGTSNRNKFTAFLASAGRDRDRGSSSEADLRTSETGTTTATGKMKGFMGGRFGKRAE